MWAQVTTKFSTLVVIIAFSAAVLFSSNSASAQSFFKVNSDTPPGGTSTTTNSSDNSSSGKTLIYVAMGAAVVGAILYKFVFHKDKDVDSTETESSSLLIPSNTIISNKDTEFAENRNPLPVNLYLAVKRDYIIPDQKTYMVGLSFNF